MSGRRETSVCLHWLAINYYDAYLSSSLSNSMVESWDVLKTSNGKRRKITHSGPLLPGTLLTVGVETVQSDESDSDFEEFDPSDDEVSDGSLRLTTNRVNGEDRETASQLVMERYLRVCRYERDWECARAEAEAVKFTWAYAVEEGPDFPPNPIWEIKVTRGREWDVICSVLELARRFPDDYDIQSASTTPATPGLVYIECTFESVVRQLLVHIAFTRRSVAPRQLSSETLKRILLLTSPPILAGSWARIGSTGQYRHDLAWVQHYDTDTRCALLYVVPRWRVAEISQQGAEQTRCVNNIQSRQALLSHHLGNSFNPAIPCDLYGETFHFGFLLCREPLHNLAIYHVNSSSQELVVWTESPMYKFPDHSVDCERVDQNLAHTVELFTRGVDRQLAAAKIPLPLQIGHRVRFVKAGDGLGSVGCVTFVDEKAEFVRVDMCDEVSGTIVSAQWPLARTALDFRVQDQVVVMRGACVGLRGRIAGVDRFRAEVDIIYNETDLRKFEDIEARTVSTANPNAEHNIVSLAKGRRTGGRRPEDGDDGRDGGRRTDTEDG
ncbi:hypothetical protein R3P38DRAFT_2794795 [Favolaschia claudopus]|uniref:NGN domain-containing protein n=1 Tax=Favolaschia claudopus TaxID=2862362 RepID=A0AAW0A8P5_9AGAR